MLRFCSLDWSDSEWGRFVHENENPKVGMDRQDLSHDFRKEPADDCKINDRQVVP